MPYTIIAKIVSESFDEKYSSYNYIDDARSLSADWTENFEIICNKLSLNSLEKLEIVNVGVGGGNEALSLFANCENITFIDIAPNGLRKVKKNIPKSKIFVSRAEDLSLLQNVSFDIYISLRTYNSSFFDIGKALFEANRILKKDGKIIISVANGFLYPKRNKIISGLLIPGTEFVDIYRGFTIIKRIELEMLNIGFMNIHIVPTNMEIFIFSTKSSKI